MRGVGAAASLAEKKLESLSPESVAKRTGSEYSGGVYALRWFGERRELSSGGEIERVLWLHYLISEGGREPGETSYVAFRELPGARFYEPKFEERAVRPIAKCFGNDSWAMVSAGLTLGGIEAGVGGRSVTLRPLPFIPITYAVWEADDEFPARAQILFDVTAKAWLNAEDMVMLASLGAYKLIKAKANK